MFTMIDNEIIYTKIKEIGTSAFAVFCYLKARQGNNESSYPSYDKICDDLGMGRATVATAIKVLIGNGFLIVEHGRCNSNSYRIKNIIAITETEISSHELEQKTESKSSQNTTQTETAESCSSETELSVVQKLNYQEASSFKTELPVVQKQNHQEDGSSILELPVVQKLNSNYIHSNYINITKDIDDNNNIINIDSDDSNGKLKPDGNKKKPTAKNKSPAQSKKEPSDLVLFREYYCQKYKEKFHEKYVWTYGKDDKLAKDLLAQAGLEAVKEKADIFLNTEFDKDDFVTKNGHTIGMFKYKYNALRKKVKKFWEP